MAYSKINFILKFLSILNENIFFLCISFYVPVFCTLVVVQSAHTTHLPAPSPFPLSPLNFSILSLIPPNPFPWSSTESTEKPNQKLGFPNAMVGMTMTPSSTEKLACLLDSAKSAADIPSKLDRLRQLKHDLVHEDANLLSHLLPRLLELHSDRFSPVRKFATEYAS